MKMHLWDLLSVVIIGLIAFFWLLRSYLIMRKNKCITVCGGCSKGKCSSKSFAKQDTDMIKFSNRS